MTTTHGVSATPLTRNDPKDVGVLLGVWAHPDDEAYLSAALMARARDAGNRVVVATATRGEHGTPDPVNWPPERLAATRELELAASLAALDVRDHHWLGHRDGGLHEVPEQDGAEQISALIASVRPDTIVTFGPDGLTGHSDHRTVSRWVTEAWHGCGRPGRLWYATLTPEFHRRWGAAARSVGFWMPGARPPSDRRESLVCAVDADQRLLDRKLVALRAHASQVGPVIDRIGLERYRRWWASEWFVAAESRDATRPLDRADAA
jgi:LmbE family N-acetylglucosaminyl deacetylase